MNGKKIVSPRCKITVKKPPSFPIINGKRPTDLVALKAQRRSQRFKNIPDIQDPAEAEPWPPPALFGSALMAAGTEDEDEDEP